MTRTDARVPERNAYDLSSGPSASVVHMGMSNATHKTRADFSKRGRWSSHTWTHSEPNKHAALVAKQAELGADGFDAGQADHHEFDRFPLSR